MWNYTRILCWDENHHQSESSEVIKGKTVQILVFLVFWNQEYFYYYFNISDGYIDYVDIFDQIIDVSPCAS